MSTQSPYEQIKFIRDVIKDRTDKAQATFFSVELESFGTVTPLVEKENGALFYDTVIQYLTRYDIAALIIKLYHGKSHNIKEPFQVIRVPIKKAPAMSLMGADKKQGIEHLQQETIISPEQHFQKLAENQFNLLRLQYENDVLKKKNKKKKAYIQELEKEIARHEKEKKGGLGNVTLGNVASNALENLAKSNFGIAMLKNVFGANDEVIQGLTGEIKEAKPALPEENSKASIVVKEEKPLTETERIRKEIIRTIVEFLEKSDDGLLRLYYEFIQAVNNDTKLLQALYLQAKKHKESLAEQKPKNSLHKVELGDSKEPEGGEEEEVDDG